MRLEYPFQAYLSLVDSDSGLLRPGTKAARQQSRAAMPLSSADTAAIKAFFSSRRGSRSLHADVQKLLADYCTAANVTAAELNVARPPEGSATARWLEEWADLAAAAGITDTFMAKNVVRWIEEEDSSIAAGCRTGKTFAVADALTKKGFTIDRNTELAISQAIAACRTQVMPRRRTA